MVFALAMLLLLLSVNRGNDWGWGSPAILGCAVGSGLLCVLLYAIEGRAVNPIIPSFLFTDRTIAIANFLPMPCGMAYHLRLLHIYISRQAVFATVRVRGNIICHARNNM